MEYKKDESINLETWEPTCRRYVCFIDIMGFKDMIATRKHTDIYDMMEKIINIQNVNSRIKWGNQDPLVRTTTYSDSIII